MSFCRVCLTRSDSVDWFSRDEAVFSRRKARGTVMVMS